MEFPFTRLDRPSVQALLGGALVLAAAVALAMGISAVQALFPTSPEGAVAATGLLCLACLGAGLGVYSVVRRSRMLPAELCLVAFVMVGIALAGVYLFWASAAVFQRADILLWSESPFVNDIIKLRVGAPLYGNPANLDSFYYTPGTQWLTYALASVAGMPTSIPAYRVIQLAYAAVAALFAASAARRVAQLSGIGPREEPVALWAAALTIVGFLVAGNAITNPFTHLLHNDALSLLVSAVAFFLLVEYAVTRRLAPLVALSLVPAVGFFVKQSLALWAPLIVGYLILFDQPRSWSRSVAFALGAVGLLGAGYGAGLLVWGAPFHYWVVTGLGHHQVSPLRAIQHALDGWAYFAAGFAAFALLLSLHSDRRLFGLWMVWLGLLAIETYTSGVAWMLNHMGPGSLLTVPWLGLLLMSAWPNSSDVSWRAPFSWLRPAAVLVLAGLILQGLGTVRIPLPSLPTDVERYVTAIESEAQGQDLGRILVDHGSWLYLPQGIVMADRMAAVGEAGYTETGDFSGVLERVRSHHYARILVRNLDGPDFMYDHYLWRQSSGIRAALQESYDVVRTIPGVEGRSEPWFMTISVLEPRVSPATKRGDSAGK